MNAYRLRIARVATILLILVAILGGYSAAAAKGRARISRLEFRNAMRQLWEDHVTWTRLYIVSAAAGLPNTDATAQRLLRNQDDIGDAIKPFYGNAAGEQLSALLRDHILIAAEVLDAAKRGDTDAFEDANARWYANADEIAAFLNAANPNQWPLHEMQMMMKEHLDLTLQEAASHLAGDYEADIAAYDEIHNQILHMADMLSVGIMKQFPGRFR
jgi:hypothetical protein